MNFNSLMIGSADAPALAAYYGKLFGKPSMEDDNFTGWELGSGWMVVGPHDEVTGSNAQPGRIIWNLESTDVLADFARLRDAGAIVVREPYQPMEGQDMWITTLSDPDGNYFQLMSPM
jgi:predicted enzyme related to lactoylglutathione lyase